LREFIVTFHDPLPAHVIDAMSIVFNLDEDNFDLLDDAPPACRDNGER
jgi:hypothetical protein